MFLPIVIGLGKNSHDIFDFVSEAKIRANGDKENFTFAPHADIFNDRAAR
jgi:hypothetical protein